VLQGKHAQVAQLLSAMAFLPSGLQGIMAAYRDSYVTPAAAAAVAAARVPSRGGGRSHTPVDGKAAAAQQAQRGVWWTPGEVPPSPEELVGAVVDVVRELPVWESRAVEEVSVAGGWGWG